MENVSETFCTTLTGAHKDFTGIWWELTLDQNTNASGGSSL